MTLQVSRRSFLVIAGTSVLVAACSSTDDANEGGGGGGVFTYTDARGKKVEIDHLPKTVVAQGSVAAALWDNGFKVKAVYGEFTKPDDYQNGDIELSQVTVLGRTWGEFNLEKFTELAPDLVIDLTYDMQKLWYAGDVEDKITKIAPGIGMQLVGLSAKQQIEAFVDLSRKLGAELGNLPGAKNDFESACQRVTAAASAKPDLVVSAMSLSATNYYVGNAKEHPDLANLAELGVKFPTVSPDQGSGPFESLSIETLGKYPADVILVDARDEAGYDAIKDNPAWTALPAVAAGQVYKWYPLAPYSYQKYAGLYNDYASHIEGARKL